MTSISLDQEYLSPTELREKFKMSKTLYYSLRKKENPLPTIPWSKGKVQHPKDEVERWLASLLG